VIFGKEFGNLAQGDDLTKMEGINLVFVMSHNEMKCIPSDRVITYALIVVNFPPGEGPQLGANYKMA